MMDMSSSYLTSSQTHKYLDIETIKPFFSKTCTLSASFQEYLLLNQVNGVGIATNLYFSAHLFMEPTVIVEVAAQLLHGEVCYRKDLEVILF